MTKSKKGGKIGPEEIKRRAEQLLTVLELVYNNPDRSVEYGTLKKLILETPRGSAVLTELFKTNILHRSSGPKNRDNSIIKYTGIEPVFIVAKKIIVSVVEQGRVWNNKQVTEGSRSGHRKTLEAMVMESNLAGDKLAPLQYNNFLKELDLLKQRYKKTVPNAQIEITVKVSSTVTV